MRACVVTFLLIPLGCGGGGESAPDPGFETGPCISGSCLGGLECRSDVCVVPGGSEASTAIGESSTGSDPTADETTTSSSTTSSSGTTTAVDTSTGTPACPDSGIVGDAVELSYIWIANTPGTVSKIDTRTGVEVARYQTGPANQPYPSETTVNLYGDVAIANHGAQRGGPGGITKIVTRSTDCIDADGNGTIETSTSSTDVRQWGSDECVVWNQELPSAMFEQGPGPTAWEGILDDEGCPSPTPRLWTAWYDKFGERGIVHRLDGATGEIEEAIPVPTDTGLDYGPMAGATDANGDFWFVFWQLGPLAHVDAQTLDVEIIPMPAPPDDLHWATALALDRHGNPWITSGGSVGVYDVARGQWEFVSTGNPFLRGLAIDGQDRALLAVSTATGGTQCGLAVVDVAARTLLADLVGIANCVDPVGVSFDVDGHPWVVDLEADLAFRLDESLQVDLTVDGLVSPYTLSDMTGTGLALVVGAP